MIFGPGCLHTLRYSSPLIVAASAVSLSAATALFVPPSRRTVLNASQRTIARYLSAIICSLHFCQGLLQALCAVSTAEWAAEPDAVTYSTLHVLLWLIIFLIQADAKQVYWLPSLITWTLALFLDTIVSLSSFQSATLGPFEFLQLSIGLLRIAALSLLCISSLALATEALPKDPEQEPLLRSSQENGTRYPSIILENDKHDDYEEDGDSATSEQRKHVEKHGGWWAYLHEVKFLLPYIVPFKDRRRQLYALVMLVLMVGGRISQLFGPRLLGNIVQEISNKQTDSTLSRQILIYIFAVKVPYEVILEPARKWLSIRLFWGSYLDLKLSLASHVAGLSYAFHENKQIGEIIAAIGQGQVINQFVDDFIESTLPLVLDIVAAFAYITYLFDVYVALILASTYVLYGLVTYKGTILCADARRKYRETSRIEWNVLQEAIGNWMSTFYLNRHEYQYNRLKTLSRQELGEQEYNYDISMIMRTCQTFVITLGYLGILLRTAHLTTHAENAVGNFVALLFYWSFFTTPLFKLASFYHSLSQVLVDIERLRQLMQTGPTVHDRENAQDLVYHEGKVEYRNVSFSYNGKNPVINNLNLTIEPGSTVAFVGQSGSGKTTTCDKLLFRAYDINRGAILIDNQDIRDVTQRTLRETVGIVRQEPVFNNDTVLENVRYAQLGASDAEVVAACKDAAIHDQIMRFPMGYNTVVGERGIKLSGGERQRLAIAQLFLRNPKIVVLDEATSSVDNVAESEIQESFARICKGRTTIIVAHRLSTVQHADQIFVLEKGTIIERGTHEELLQKHGKYCQLWNKTQTVKKLKSELKRVESHDTEEHDEIGSSSMLLDDSDYDNSDFDDSTDDPEYIMQIDGASSSKQAEDDRTGARWRIHSLKEKFNGSRYRVHNDQWTDGGDDKEECFSPMCVMSPRITEASPPPTLSRRSSRPRRRSSRARKANTISSPPLPAKIDKRSISAPLSPVRVQNHDFWLSQDSFGLNHPVRMQVQEHVSPTLDQVAQAHRQISTPYNTPISTIEFTTPVRTRQNATRELLLRSPQSPGQNAALRSHPILRDEDEGEGSGTTYYTPGTSVGSPTDGSQRH